MHRQYAITGNQAQVYAQMHQSVFIEQNRAALKAMVIEQLPREQPIAMISPINPEPVVTIDENEPVLSKMPSLHRESPNPEVQSSSSLDSDS